VSERQTKPLSVEGKEFLLTSRCAISYEYVNRVWFSSAILYLYSGEHRNKKDSKSCATVRLQQVPAA